MVRRNKDQAGSVPRDDHMRRTAYAASSASKRQVTRSNSHVLQPVSRVRRVGSRWAVAWTVIASHAGPPVHGVITGADGTGVECGRAAQTPPCSMLHPPGQMPAQSGRLEGCANAFMQLAGTRGAGRRASRVDAGRLDDPPRGWSAGRAGSVPVPSLLQHQQQVAGLLGNPAAVGVGGHPGQVHTRGVVFDEEQHIQPPQEHLPAASRPPWRRVQPVTAKRGSDPHQAVAARP